MADEEFEIESEVHDLRHVEPSAQNKDCSEEPLDDVSQGAPRPLPDHYLEPEIEWMLSLITDKGLLKLKDVMLYRVEGMEYFRNPDCQISCGTMRYLIGCVDEELKWRREKGVKVEY